jgi:hypothetical protein
MTRIYISDSGNDKNDGLTKQTPIYSWKRARKLFTGQIEISADNASTRKRLMKELCERTEARWQQGIRAYASRFIGTTQEPQTMALS